MADNSVTISIEDICESVQKCISKTRFLYTGKKWLMFDGIKWVLTCAGIRDLLSTEVHDFYEKFRTTENSFIIDEVQFKLKHSEFKKLITRRCKSNYFVPLNLLDPHVNKIICFSNGAYFKDEKCIKNEIDSSHYITVWFNLPYDKNNITYDIIEKMSQLQSLYVKKRNCKQQKSIQTPNTPL
jgi:hypothetical protein